MKIGLTHKNGKYGFVVVAKNDNKDQAIFDSFKHHSLIPFLSSGYEYAWKAQKDANTLLRDYSHHLRYAREDLMRPIITDISAEEMLQNHYMGIFDGLEDKTHGVRKEPQEIKDNVFQEAKIVRNELEAIMEQEEQIEDEHALRKLRRILKMVKNLIRKHFSREDAEDKKKEAEAPAMPAMPPMGGDMGGAPPMPGAPPGGAPPLMASVMDPESSNMKVIDKEVKEELIEYYGEKVCEAIQNRHKGAHYVVGGSRSDELVIFNKRNSPILKVGMNEKFHVDRIIPIGDVYKMCPYHTAEFYQRYWKPIVEGVGHFYIKDASTLILPEASSLPDTPKGNGGRTIQGWNAKENKVASVEVSFRGKKPCWFFDTANVEKNASHVSEYTEQDYINAMVKCTDSKLESIFGRTGEVIQIIPHDDFIEVDVDFKRGIGVVRLTESQLEIISV